MNHALDDETRDASGSQSEAAAETAVIAQSRVLDLFLAVAHPVPRIVALLAHDFFEAAADEEFHPVETGVIHMTEHGMHHSRSHVVRPQACVAVAQSRIDDPDCFHGIGGQKMPES